MKPEEKPNGGSIVPSGNRGLSVRASALVARGMRDLALRAPWVSRQVFDREKQLLLGISSRGHVCTYTKVPVGAGHRLEIHNIEQDEQPVSFLLPARPLRHGQTDEIRVDLGDLGCWLCTRRAAWSACGTYLAVPLARPETALWILDVTRREVALKCELKCELGCGSLHNYDEHHGFLAWSRDGKYLASGRLGCWHAPFRFWELNLDSGGPAIEHSTELRGVEPLSFSPDNKILAAAIEAPDSLGDLLLLDMPSLRERGRVKGGMESVYGASWSKDGKHLVWHGASWCHLIEIDTLSETKYLVRGPALGVAPFWALGNPVATDEWAFCETRDANDPATDSWPVCKERWLDVPEDDLVTADQRAALTKYANATNRKLSDVMRELKLAGVTHYRVFVSDLEMSRVIAEWCPDTFSDMQWSSDGRTLYTISEEGQGYVFKLPAR